MSTSISGEKEWIKKIQMGRNGPVSPVNKAKLGFKDVAGMNELKKSVTECFIKVLNNPEMARPMGLCLQA